MNTRDFDRRPSRHPDTRQATRSLPTFLRVDEVAKILRISRSAAYEMANAWLATDGESGLPAVRLGRSIRIPRTTVERLLDVGTRADVVD